MRKKLSLTISIPNDSECISSSISCLFVEFSSQPVSSQFTHRSENFNDGIEQIV